MAAYSYFPLIQGIFGGDSPNLTSITTRDAAPTTVPSAMATPSDLASIATFLFSFSALTDWLKLFILGGLFETLRRLSFALYEICVSYLFITASFDEEDTSYRWMLTWLSKQPAWSKARDVEITTHPFWIDNPSFTLEGEDKQTSHLSKSSRKLSYLPSVATTYSIWYKRRRMTITRIQKPTGIMGRKENTLHISILTRDNGILTELMTEARREYMEDQEHSMCIFVSDTFNKWKHVACRAKRSLQSIILDEGLKSLLIDDAKDFLRSKSWYSARGIPFRRGYLLYGAPGSGKTSMIHCMAGELRLDVYIISLSRASLDDSSLSELINALPERCIALMEDIDAAFTHGINRESPQQNSQPVLAEHGPGFGKPNSPSTNRISLSGLLNALDGVGAQEGRILFATTNNYSSLDSALCRPGRMDLHVEFKLASKEQARKLFSRFYLPTDILMSENDKEMENSTSESSELPITIDQLDADFLDEQTGLAAGHDFNQPTRHEILNEQCLNSNRSKILTLAKKFAEAIPSREISMASLQGYLMTYKTRPLDALKNIEIWVEAERALRIAKEASKTAPVLAITPASSTSVLFSSASPNHFSLPSDIALRATQS